MFLTSFKCTSRNVQCPIESDWVCLRLPASGNKSRPRKLPRFTQSHASVIYIAPQTIALQPYTFADFMVLCLGSPISGFEIVQIADTRPTQPLNLFKPEALISGQHILGDGPPGRPNLAAHVFLWAL